MACVWWNHDSAERFPLSFDLLFHSLACRQPTAAYLPNEQTDITGHQVEVTQPIKDYINTKFERIKRHFDQLIDVHVILNVENKVRHKAEATMLIGGKKFFAESTEEGQDDQQTP